MNEGGAGGAEELAEDLRQLARVPDLSTAMQLDIARLWSLVAGSHDRLELLLDRLAEAIDTMPEPEKSAARHIFVRRLPWRRDLGARQKAAANSLDKKQATFRTRRGGEPSPYDRLTIAVAHYLLASHTMRPVVRDLPPTSRTAVLTSNRRIEGCHIPVGALMTPVPELSAVVDGLQRIYDADGDQVELGCPEHTAQSWGALWTQNMAGAGRPPGTLVLRSDGGGLWMERALFEAYFRSGGEDGSAAQAIAGLPYRREEFDDGSVGVWMTLGGLLHAEVPVGPAHWVPSQAFETWDSLGRSDGPLGNPLADVNWRHGRLHQDFAGGHLHLDESGVVVAELVDSCEVERELAKAAFDEPSLINQYDRTTWYLEGGRRRWVSWDLLDRLVPRLRNMTELSAAAVARFSLGPPMTDDELTAAGFQLR